MAADPSKTIIFFPEGAYGPTNNCVGIGDVLRRRGHRVVFVVEESFAGMTFRAPRLPVYSCATSRRMPQAGLRRRRSRSKAWFEGAVGRPPR